MTLWICDRCGQQVIKESYGAGKYDISKSCLDPTTEILFRRRLKFCDDCAMQMEKFLDDEFDQIPMLVTCEVDKRN